MSPEQTGGESRYKSKLIAWSPETISLRGVVDVPKWFDLQLWRDRWPGAIVISVFVDPVNGATLTGVRADRAVNLHYKDAVKLLADWGPGGSEADLLQWATTESAARALAIRFVDADSERQFAVGDTRPYEERMSDTAKAAREVGDIYRRLVSPHARPQRRRLITPELLAEVADVYRKALAGGQPPTKAVEQHFGITHTSAARWVREARSAGVLGPSQGPKPGEATPSE